MAAAAQMLRMAQLAKSSAGSWLLYESRFKTSAVILAAERARGAVPMLESAANAGSGFRGEKAEQPRFSSARVLRLGAGLTGAALLIQLTGSSVRCAPQPVQPGSNPSGSGSSQPSAAGGPDAGEHPQNPWAMLPGLENVDVKELGTQVSLGSVAGFCSGYAVKKVSKVAAFGVGLIFIGIQLARYYGVVEDIQWKKIEDRLVETLDVDGDGKLTAVDFKVHFDKAVEILGFNLPSGAAFGSFFLLGLRWG